MKVQRGVWTAFSAELVIVVILKRLQVVAIVAYSKGK